MAKAPILLHIPHASRTIPEDVAGDFLVSQADLERELTTMTDAYTDDLFDLPGADRLVAQVSRLVVDVERFLDNAEEPMSARGMGVVYESTHDVKPLKRATRRGELIERYYKPHHEALESWTTAQLKVHGRCLILDCHSFPSQPIPCDRDQMIDRPDICLGTAGIHTPRQLLEATVNAFETRGLSVTVDRPYAGSIVPRTFLDREPAVASIMIEINRHLYMNEATGGKLPDYQKFRKLLMDALAEIPRC